MQVVTEQVIEVEPRTLLQHLQGRRPCTVLDAPDGNKVQVEFTYHPDDDGDIDADQVGASNYKHTPVVNARVIKRLVEGGPVSWSMNDLDMRYYMKLVEPNDQEGLRQALRGAFRAHDYVSFGGKDPRRVWREDSDYADEFDYTDYIPEPH